MAAALQRTLDGIRASPVRGRCRCAHPIYSEWSAATRRALIALMATQDDASDLRFDDPIPEDQELGMEKLLFFTLARPS